MCNSSSCALECQPACDCDCKAKGTERARLIIRQKQQGRLYAIKPRCVRTALDLSLPECGHHVFAVTHRERIFMCAHKHTKSAH
jgi:hypothetical protein